MVAESPHQQQVDVYEEEAHESGTGAADDPVQESSFIYVYMRVCKWRCFSWKEVFRTAVKQVMVTLAN